MSTVRTRTIELERPCGHCGLPANRYEDDTRGVMHGHTVTVRWARCGHCGHQVEPLTHRISQ